MEEALWQSFDGIHFVSFRTLEHNWTNWLRDFYTPASADDVALPGTWVPPVDIYENGKGRARNQGGAAGFRAGGRQRDG